MCQLCGPNLGDEIYLVFAKNQDSIECSIGRPVWLLPDIFLAHQTMQQFIWWANPMLVANLLDAGMRKMQTVGPDDGATISSSCSALPGR